jgi:outer membrane protein insertion porin family
MVMLHCWSLLILTALVAVAETDIRITGARANSESQILGMLGDRLEQVRSHQASPSRADDAAFILRQILRKDGYLSVQVDWKIISRHEILLHVREGGRLSLGQVTIEGVSADKAAELAKLYARPARENHSIASGDPPFREEDVKLGISNILQQLNAEGYWTAEAAIIHRVTQPTTGSVDLSIRVNPRPLHRIARANITSPDGDAVAQTKVVTEPFIGLSATTENLTDMRHAVEKTFQRSGYPDAQIQMTRTLTRDQFTPVFTIDLGKRVRLHQVHVDGLKMTNPQRIMDRMKNLEGDWYDEAAMDQRIRGLLGTGAFSSVMVNTQPFSETEIDATLTFEEGRARSVSIAAGVDSYQGFLLRTTYADRNLMGQLLGFSSGFEFSARGVLGETKLTDPWLFGSDISGTLRAYALIYGREGYDSFETGVEAKSSWEISQHYTLDLLAGYSLINLSGNGLPDSALGETVYLHPYLRFIQTLDHRDSPILPTSGWHIEMPIEIGAAVGDFSTSYLSSSLVGGWYHRINSRYQLGLGGHCEFLIPSGEGDTLPIDLRLFNGGSRSVRSFRERDLGPAVNGYATGGEATWNTSAELTRTLGGSFKALAFFDAGSLSRRFDEIGSGELELAAGLGLRIDLPIGPVRFEYGYNLTQDPGEPDGTFHFAIGASF